MRASGPVRSSKAPSSVAALPLFLLAASYASAQVNGNGPYRADLRLRAGFEQVEVEDGSGGTFKNSTWTQQVFSSASGPLGSPMLGKGSVGFEYSSGDEANRFVQGTDPARRLVGYSLRGQLLPEEIRRYFTLNPSFRQTENRMEWGGMPGSKYRDTDVGGTAGLTLPNLPRFHVSYNDVKRRDDTGTSSFNQDVRSIRQRSSYVRGPFHWEYDRQIQDIGRPIGAGAETRMDTTVSSADLNYYGIKRMGVQDLFARVSYTGSEVSNNAASQTRRGAAENLYVTSRSVSRWGVNFFGRAGQSMTTDFGDGGAKFGNDLALYSRYSDKRWNVENRTQYMNSPERADSVGNRLNVGSSWYGDLLRHSFQGEEAYLFGGGQDPAVRESVLQRLALYPDRRFDVYVKHAYDGERATGGETRSRRLTFGGGGGVYPVREVTAGLDYERRRSRPQPGAARSVSDRVAMSVRSQPINRLSLQVAYIFENYEYIGASGGERTTGSLNAECSYNPLPGLTARARVNQASRSLRSGDSEPIDVALSSEYRVGRSSFSALWESRQVSTPRKFRRFNVSLTRDF